METGEMVNPHVNEQPISEIATQEQLVSDTAIPPDVWLVPIGFLAIAWFFILMRHSLTLKVLYRRIKAKEFLQPIPCQSCRFFKNSPYLQCAVHPSRALRVDAIDCPDFWSQDKAKFSR